MIFDREEIAAERWAKIPGWKLEVSDLGRVRFLTGRMPATELTNGRWRVRALERDDGQKQRRMFTVSGLVLAAFGNHPLNVRARHLDGDDLNCRLTNLAPDGFVAARAPGRPAAFVDPCPQARAECIDGLRAEGVPAEIIDPATSERTRNPTKAEWSAIDHCIAALIARDLDTRRIGKGLGMRTWAVQARCRKKGIVLVPRVEPETIHGEAWRAVPGYRAKVSNLGRVVGPTGHLIRGSEKNAGRPRVKVCPTDGTRERSVMVASLVLSVFRDCPLHVPARHLNGDVRDCRLSNLEVGVQGPRPHTKKGDGPWARAQDNALRKAPSFAEAARLTGHTEAYCRKRMRLLGLQIAVAPIKRRGRSAELVERPLANLDLYVGLLEKAGIDDRTINLGLRILRHGKGQKAEAQEAIGTCVATLLRSGCSRQQVGEAIGQPAGTVGEWMVRLGLRSRRPDGWRTKAGPIDPQDGEEWRQVEGFPHIVSSHGRVATPTGFLMSPTLNNQGRYHVLLSRPGEGRQTRIVHRLVLEAFKPELAGRPVRWLNGDETDNRVENLVPKSVVMTESAPIKATTRTGNLNDRELGPIAGSIPRGQTLWARANAIVPEGYDQHDREDMISDIVMMIMDGRAPDAKSAFAIARREHNAMMGKFTERSLDAPIGPDGSFKLLDVLTSDGDV